MEIATSKETKKEIPVVKGIPVMGSTLELMKDPLAFCVKNYKKYGSIFKIKTIYEDYVVMAGLEANQFLSRNGNDVFSSEKVWTPFALKAGAEKTLISADGPYHAHLRRIMMPGYSPAALMGKEQATIELVAKILDTVIDKEPQRVVPFFKDFVVEVLGNLITGTSAGTYKKYLIYYLRAMLNVTVVKMWPEVMLHTPKFKKAKKKVMEFALLALENHKDYMTKENSDLLDDLLKAKAEGKLDFSDSDMHFAVVAPFFAGIDTVANNCAYLLWVFLEYPEVLSRVRAEMDEYFTSGNELNMKDLRKLENMLFTVMETLRRYPVAPIFHRTAAVDFEFNGYTVKKDQNIYIAQGVTHFLEEIFPDPYTFDIDRYQTGREENKVNSAHSPYGLGAHKCLGFRLNEIITVLVMGYLAHYVEMEKYPKDYKLKISALPTPGPDNSFKVKFTKRKI
ncbi:MAG: cytochrome P450 [Chitinophagales bacterium]|nr:cytochrome P450 [Chitinophagales bacterium]